MPAHGGLHDRARDHAQLATLESLARELGFVVWPAAQALARAEHVAASRPDALLVELNDAGDPRLMHALRARFDPTPRLLCAPEVNARTALALAQSLQIDLVLLPIDRDALAATLAHVRARASRELDRGRLAQEAIERAEVLFQGTSPQAQHLREQAARVASADRSTVLLRADPGTDLRALARWIHARSPRAAGPFVEVFAAELSSPNQARTLRELFARSAGGTLSLQGIDALDLTGQLALQEELMAQSVATQRSREGGPRAGVRLVASTSVALEPLVRERRFREDLHYRLNVLTLRVPGLGERRGDMAHLARAELERWSSASGAVARAFARDALDMLEAHAWRAGPEELFAVVGLAAMRAGGRTISASDLRSVLTAPLAPDAAHESSLRTCEEAMIRRVMLETCGNKSLAARILGIHRATLHTKLRALERR